MPRAALTYLEQWLNEPLHKPLIIRGARQIGKTRTVRDLAEQTGRKLIEFNFEKMPQLKSLFVGNDVQRILLNIETHLNETIDVARSILFLDEIQAEPELLAKLRWFAEDLPELPVVAAGSLLDFVLHEHTFSMPVGRVTYLYMEPLSFEEFLLAQEKFKMVEFLQAFDFTQKIPEALHVQFTESLKEYSIVGGMPAAVYAWQQQKSLAHVNRIHHDLLGTYRDDFAKYAGKISLARIEDAFNALPRLLGKKVVYKEVNPDVQAASIKAAIHLLSQARVCHRVNASAGNGVPLGAESNEKFFKALFLDVGLVSAALGLSLQKLDQEKNFWLVNRGGVAEQLAGQLLRCTFPGYIDPSLYYWMRNEKNANAEVDYLMQHENNVLPIEVKAGSTGGLKSLHLFMQLKQLKQAVRFNGEQPNITKVASKIHNGAVVEYQLMSLPLYLVGQLPRLLRQLQASV